MLGQIAHSGKMMLSCVAPSFNVPHSVTGLLVGPPAVQCMHLLVVSSQLWLVLAGTPQEAAHNKPRALHTHQGAAMHLITWDQLLVGPQPVHLTAIQHITACQTQGGGERGGGCVCCRCRSRPRQRVKPGLHSLGALQEANSAQQPHNIPAHK